MNKEALRQFLVDSNKAGYAGGDEKNGSKNPMVRQLFLLKKGTGDLMITSLAANHMAEELLCSMIINLTG